MDAQIVIALYRPKDGKEEDLHSLVKDHVPTLRRLELATDRTPVIARAKDGTVVEVFEWRSEDASRQAHTHPEVAKIWEAMGQISDFTNLGGLAEAEKPFPHFEPLSM